MKLGRSDVADVGEMLGAFNGNILGNSIGARLGIFGPKLGDSDCNATGIPLGGMVGICVGLWLFILLGTSDVAIVGMMLGLLDGSVV